MKLYLALASSLYGLVIEARNRAFDRGWLKAKPVPVPVISIGNISVGGTGKTPLVGYIAGRFCDEGKRVVVVTRGYKRNTRTAVVVSDGEGNVLGHLLGGDEPVMLARRDHRVVILADRNRHEGCLCAVRDFSADIILLDDAFQHRHCARNVDIVTLDSSNPGFGDSLLPLGRLREPLRGLRRAHAVVLTKWKGDTDAEAIEKKIREVTNAKIFYSRYNPSGVATLFGDTDTSHRNVFAFCGIGSPGSFMRSLEAVGMHVTGSETFPDHYRYSTTDVRALVDAARRSGAQAMITTEKDAVRIASMQEAFLGFPVCFLRMEVDFTAQTPDFLQWLASNIS